MDAHIDVAAMNAGAPHTSDDVMVDDGTGTVTAFLVDDFRRVRVEDSAVGEFQLGRHQRRAAPQCVEKQGLRPSFTFGGAAQPRCPTRAARPRWPRRSTWFRTSNKKKVRLYQVAGSDAVLTHAVEKTHAAAELLNPKSVFVVVDCARHRVFVWVCR